MTVFFQVHHSLEFHVIPGPWNANSCLRQSSSLTVTRHPLCGSSIQSATQQSPSLPRQRVPLASAPIPKQRGRKLAAGANGPLGAGKWVGVRPPSCPGQAQRAWVEGEAGEPAGLRNPWGAYKALKLLGFSPEIWILGARGGAHPSVFPSNHGGSTLSSSKASRSEAL